LVRRTRRSTPFPYTTLFRSNDVARGPIRPIFAADYLDIEPCTPIADHFAPPSPGDSRTSIDLRKWRGYLFDAALVGPQGRGEGGDRKSTRLNSSHVKISYAV